MGWHKTLSQAFPVNGLTSVDAAIYDQVDTAYLLSGNIMYTFSVSGTLPAVTFTFISTFDLTVNNDHNPFKATLGSPLPQAPSGINALHRSENGKMLLAFVGADLYQYNQGNWTFEGTSKTPCS